MIEILWGGDWYKYPSIEEAKKAGFTFDGPVKKEEPSEDKKDGK